MLDAEVIFMDEPDEVRVGLWASSLSDDSGIMLEFIKNDSPPRGATRMIRISTGNLADALELAHLIEKTVKSR